MSSYDEWLDDEAPTFDGEEMMPTFDGRFHPHGPDGGLGRPDARDAVADDEGEEDETTPEAEAKRQGALIRIAFLRIKLALAAGEGAFLKNEECRELLAHINRVRKARNTADRIVQTYRRRLGEL